MCIKAKAPPPLPAIRPVPTRVEASRSSLTEEARKRAASAGGVFSNIFTTPLGDANFGKNTARASDATMTLGY